jgi:RNA polymerase sigma-70 factor (ECF subfamily)
MGPPEPSTSPTLLRELYNPENGERAWHTFLARYQPLIEAWCRGEGLNPADAEEVVARVLSSLARALRDFCYDPAGRFRAWLRTVVHNAVGTFRREQRRRPGDRGSGDSDVRDALAQVPAPAEESLAEDLGRRLEEDLETARRVTEVVKAQVKSETWRAWWLTAIEGRPAAEVAAALGMTVAAVYVAKHRVGHRLREEGRRVRGGGQGGAGA